MRVVDSSDDDVPDEELTDDERTALAAVRSLRRLIEHASGPLRRALRNELTVVVSRIDSIDRGLFREHQPADDDQLDQAERASKRPENVQALLREGKRRHPESAPYVDAAIREANERLKEITASLALDGLRPKEISEVLRKQHVGEAQANEKAVNTRLAHLRRKGFQQPVSPASKRKRTITR